jgi:hypothetical protein
MAKLDFCPTTFTIRSLLDEGRREDARKMIIEKSNEGFCSKEFVELIVDEFVKMKNRGKLLAVIATRRQASPAFRFRGRYWG